MQKINAVITLGLNNSQNQDELKMQIESIFDALSHFSPQKRSTLYKTPAFPTGSGPDFINAAICIQTELSPHELLENLHSIENQFNRERPYRWAPRSCDLDLIFYDQQILPSQTVFTKYAAFSTEQAISNTPETLILPHPRMHERAFVLGPLREIAPDFIHPVFKKTVDELWQNLPIEQREEIHKISE